jgi:hypothetical protein
MGTLSHKMGESFIVAEESIFIFLFRIENENATVCGPVLPQIAAVDRSDAESNSRCYGGEKVVALETGGDGGGVWCRWWWAAA